MIGQFVISKAGRDKGTIYVVVREQADCLYLADGVHKMTGAPKKKNRKHVQPMNQYLPADLTEEIRTGEIAVNEHLRSAISKQRDNGGNVCQKVM